MPIIQNIGIIGGTGQLGSSIVQALLISELILPSQVWVSNRSGKSPAHKGWDGVNFTSLNQDLIDACPVVILSVPPHLVPTLQISAKNCLLISVMAGVTIEAIENHTGGKQIIRAMSSPAAAQRQAYSPWCMNTGVTQEDREIVNAIFEACGLTDEVFSEDHIDVFTVLTGPVPGFVAFYADCLAKYSVKHGISPEIANRAIRQLFLASGTTMAQSSMSPQEHVTEMIDYAGTTAGGLEAMQQSPMQSVIEDALDKAHAKTKTIGK